MLMKKRLVLRIITSAENAKKSMSDYKTEDILFFSDVINGLPRKILNYHTPEELFETQLDRIYAT